MTQRTRLFGEEKAQIHSQMKDNLDNLNQFVQSQKHDEISQSYYFGMTVADVALLSDSILHEGISLVPMMLQSDKDDLPPEAHFAYLNMKYSRGGIDLIQARKALNRYVKSKRVKKWWIPALAVYALSMIGVGAYLWLELDDVNNRTNEIYGFISRPDVVEMQSELNRLIQETNDIFRISQQFNNRIEWEETMPVAASPMIEWIIFGHGLEVTVTSFNFNEATGIVQINAESGDAEIANDYVAALYEVGIAARVIYTGYRTGGDGTFSFSLDIKLAIENGEEE
jgi:hypothetical protein